jgi:phenylalanyl-tRNA synthetase beta chain
VDATNYVLMECGQPLHAFDLAKLAGPEIVVRAARRGERFAALNHRTYDLEPGMCAIADARVPVALGGVMGGESSEVTGRTTDLLIESAEFDPVSVRGTARRLALHSDSSFRFERGVDPQGVDWASRRCCQLILETAGGTLAAGSVDVGRKPHARQPITLRLAQLKRILGIDVDLTDVRRILVALGNVEQESGEAAGDEHSGVPPAGDQRRIVVVPPSWRRDVAREIDLVEEVARIHGYDEIPEDAPVAMVASARTPIDRVLDKMRQVLTASGLDEAITASAVPEEWSAAFSPWTDAEPLICATPVLRRADRLRRSLVPSLLDARHTNEALANETIELFEIARVYLPQSPDAPPAAERDKQHSSAGLPREPLMLAIASGRDFYAIKGVIEAILIALDPGQSHDLAFVDSRHDLLDPARSCAIHVDGQRLGFLGHVSDAGRTRFDLRRPATVAEIDVDVLRRLSRPIPKYAKLPAFPAIDRDLNLVVAESVRWSDLADTARQSAGEYLETLQYLETYRNPKDPQLGAARKSLLLTLRLRSREGTLTGDQADAIRDRIVAACRAAHGAELRA